MGLWSIPTSVNSFFDHQEFGTSNEFDQGIELYQKACAERSGPSGYLEPKWLRCWPKSHKRARGPRLQRDRLGMGASQASLAQLSGSPLV